MRIAIAFCLLVLLAACHFDQTPEPEIPIDGIPCDSTQVYFQNTVLPLLVSNCATPGCHDPGTASEGIQLTTYSSIMNSLEISPFNPDAGDLMEVITETDPDKMMPPPPRARLTAAQIQLLRTWILQGAQNNGCDESAGGCDTANLSYATHIKPIIDGKCLGCHNTQSPGGGINFSTHAGVSGLALAPSGVFMGAVRRLQGFSPMPKNGPRLTDCQIDRLQAWINRGAPNN
jgi:hypothetical protein